MEENPQFKIYRSSAGSGKTYRLAADYLKLALRHPQYYRRILAVTFTNKATWEMKARIIENLHALTTGKAQQGLVELLQLETGWDKLSLQERSGNVLKAVLHGYGYFSVSTIDSFFQRVVAAFARDIEVKGGFSIEFDLEAVSDEIVDMIFLELGNDRELMDWLVRYTESKIEDNKSWDVRQEIKNLASELYSDRFFLHVKGTADSLPQRDVLSSLLSDIKTDRAAFVRKLRNFGRDGLAMMERSGVTVDDLYHTNQGPGGLIARMEGGDDQQPNGWMREAYERKDKWTSGKCRNREAVKNMLDAGLFDHYRSAIDYYDRNIGRQRTFIHILKLFYTIGLYSNLLENLKKYRNDHDAILISDLSKLLRIIVGENDAPYIYEKVGNQYQHFLIDEFQDTSLYQWHNFKPLVKNSLAMGNYNMIVGDIKQSIYRWRGGDWQLLHEQVEEDIGRSYVVEDNLKINWRSRQNIILFNNNLFGILPGLFRDSYLRNLPDALPADLHEKARRFSERFVSVYRDVSQELPPGDMRKKEGVISVRFLSGGNERDKQAKWENKMFDQLAGVVHGIQDRGYSPGDIAVLVRTKNEGKKVADYLLGYKNLHPESPYRYDVISSESLFLSSSPAVNAAISYMKLVLDKNDSLSLINLTYWLAVLKSDRAVDDLAGLFGSLFENVDQGIIGPDNGDHPANGITGSMPLTDVLELTISKLGLDAYPLEQAYLTGLQNVLLDYLSKGKNDLFSFMDWWETNGKKQSIKPAEGQDAIQILTIHQAKGLQFEMVLIPFCTWTIDHKPNSTIIWCSGKEEPLDRIPFYPVKYETELLETGFGPDYLDERSLAYMDNLNLLYVALTRSISGLFVFAEKPSATAKIKTAGDVLFHAMKNPAISGSGQFEITAGEDQEGDEFLLYHSGNLNDPERPEKELKIFKAEGFVRINWRERISIRQQADLFSQEEDGYKDDEYINYGNLVHEMLSRIYLKEQVEEVIHAELVSGGLRAGQENKVREMLDRLWENEKVTDWFSGRWKVKTEVPVLPKTGQIRRMDRVMLMDDHAIVVDFKTGAFREEHIFQVEAYKQILRNMGYARADGFLLYLGSGKLIAV